MSKILTLKRLEEMCQEARKRLATNDETTIDIWDNQEDRWVELLEEDICI